jgi:hypothetical protein
VVSAMLARVQAMVVAKRVKGRVEEIRESRVDVPSNCATVALRTSLPIEGSTRSS